MSSGAVFNAMEAGNWEKVKEMIVTTCWTPTDLDSRHLRQGYTLLIKAAMLGKEDVIRLLLDAGAAKEMKEYDNGLNALCWAVYYGHLKIAEMLLDRGANIDARSLGEWTPLIEAASNGCYELVALLIERGANINATNQDGWTALIVAVQRVYVTMVKLLCSKGADLNMKDKDGRDALFYAIYYSRFGVRRGDTVEIIAALQEEAEWRRVKNFIVLLCAGGLSSADWSVRSLGGVCLMPTADEIAAANSSTRVILSGRQSHVLENRDLCRIVASYIPKLR